MLKIDQRYPRDGYVDESEPEQLRVKAKDIQMMLVLGISLDRCLTQEPSDDSCN